MHWETQDIWKLGIGYVDPEEWGDGGFEIYLGRWVLCVWKQEEG